MLRRVGSPSAAKVASSEVEYLTIGLSNTAQENLSSAGDLFIDLFGALKVDGEGRFATAYVAHLQPRRRDVRRNDELNIAFFCAMR